MFPFKTLHTYMRERSPWHRLLLGAYLGLTICIILGINISWFGTPIYDRVISFVLLWFFYPIFALILEYKHSQKTQNKRVEELLGNETRK